MKNHRLNKSIVIAGCVTAIVGLTLFVAIDQQKNVPEPAGSQQAAADKAASVGNLIDGLEARLADSPDDAKGWILLARSHDHLGNNERAWSAYSHARDLGMTDESLEIKLAANIVGSLEQ